MRHSWLVVVFLALAASSQTARAAVIEYFGPHPVESAYGSGMCVVDGAHVHVYEPKETVYYVQDGPYWTYVGDPTEFRDEPAGVIAMSDERPLHAYYGHHPVWWTSAPGEHYCYITGPHNHGYAPLATLSFEVRGGAYWYVGTHPAWYERRKRDHVHVDKHYARTGVIRRPVVTVAPPVGWVGVQLSIGLPAPVVVHERPRPIIVHEVRPAPVVIEHHHHHHDKHKHKHKHKHKGHHRGGH